MLEIQIFNGLNDYRGTNRRTDGLTNIFDCWASVDPKKTLPANIQHNTTNYKNPKYFLRVPQYQYRDYEEELIGPE